MYLSIRLEASSSNDIFVLHLFMFRWWIPLVHCSDYRYLLLTFVQKANDANTDWNGFLFRLDKTRFFIWIDHNDSPTVCSIKCSFICIGFALLWNFFLIELRSLGFLHFIFLLLVSKQTYTETIFELSPPQTPDFSVVSRHSQLIFPNCDSFPTNGHYLFAHHLLHGPSGGTA
jgi:hypothetical protein